MTAVNIIFVPFLIYMQGTAAADNMKVHDSVAYGLLEYLYSA
jgi:hypothetical protein